MGDTEHEQEQVQSVTTSRPKPALSLRPMAASAAPIDPAAAAEPGDIITTIVLKPGVRVTIEYPK